MTTITGLEPLEALAAEVAQPALLPDTPPRPTKSKRRKKDKRTRCQFRFWLDAEKDSDRVLGVSLADLKRARKFQATIRDALRLFLDLAAGKTDVLAELFPAIVEQLKTPVQPAASEQFEALMSEIHALKGQLAQQPTPRPALVEDVDLIEVRQDTNTNANQNFLNSLMALQGVRK